MSKSLDRLALLEMFVRIAERGSISAAARDLGLSQASASRQLSALEQIMGAQLVQRTTHSLSLTEAGEDCLLDARVLIESWDALVEQFDSEETDIRGKLKVVAPIALGQLYLAESALNFQRSHPNVSINWVLEDAAIKFSEIGCDLWIKMGLVPDDTLVVRPMAKVERLIVCSPTLIKGKRPSRPKQLEALPAVVLEPFEAASIPLMTQSGKEEKLRADVALNTNNIFAARKAAVMGIGYAVMPRWLVEQDLADGTLLDVLPDWRAPFLTINAAYLPSRRQSNRLKLFLDHIMQSIKAIPGIEPA